MDSASKTIIWGQFGASIDALENAIRACPDEVWGNRIHQSEYWYLAYHTIFWLDYYLAESKEHFAPPEPYGMEEMDPAGALPPRVYSKDEMLGYLEHGRQKARAVIASMTEAKAKEAYNFGKIALNYVELVLYVMRHNQHHAAQLNLLLRQRTDSAPRWTFRSRVPLEG